MGNSIGETFATGASKAKKLFMNLSTYFLCTTFYIQYSQVLTKRDWWDSSTIVLTFTSSTTRSSRQSIRHNCYFCGQFQLEITIVKSQLQVVSSPAFCWFTRTIEIPSISNSLFKNSQMCSKQ